MARWKNDRGSGKMKRKVEKSRLGESESRLQYERDMTRMTGQEKQNRRDKTKKVE